MFKKILRITLKTTMWVFIGVFAIIIIAVIALQLPQTQSFLTGKAEAFLEKKIKTRVDIGRVNVAFPKSVVLEDIYLEDQKKDTLLFAHKIAIDVAMMGIIKNKVEINNIELERITGHVYRTMPDSSFNFDYIVDAFASDSTKEETPEDTTKGGLDIKVMGLELKDIYVTFLDEVTGTDAIVKLGKFEVEMDEFDLNQKTFIVDFIEFHNTTASLVQSKLPKSTQDSESQPLDMNIGIGEINLSGIKLTYDNLVNKQEINLNLGKLNLKSDKIDLPRQVINLDELELSNTSIVYAQNKSIIKDSLVHEKVAKKVGSELEQEAKESGMPWTVTLGELKMVSNSLKFDDYNVPAQKEGIDFKHLKVEGLGMDIEDIAYSGLEVSAGINQFVFREKSGFRLNKLSALLKLDSTSATLADLDLRTNQTQIKDHLEIGFTSLDKIADDLGNLKMNINLDETVVAFEDILYFQPGLAKNIPFAGNEKEKIFLTGKLKGRVGDLSIPKFTLDALNSTHLIASGRIKGLPDMEKTFIDIKVTKLSSTAKDIRGFLPKGSIPTSIALPATMDIKADFKGYLNNFDANANVNTSLGNASAKIAMEPPRNGKEVYNATLNIDKFQLGKLLKQDSLLGPLTLEAKVAGEGLSPETVAATLNAKVKEAVLKGYRYSNLTIDGKVVQKSFAGKINYSDSNLVFAFDGALNFNKETPFYKFKFDLKGADLNGLQLSENDLRVKTKIEADISGSDLNNINGDLGIKETFIIQNGKQYNVESFLLASINEKRKTDIKIESDIFDAAFAGTINLGDLGITLQQHINQYFFLNNPKIKKPTEPQDFSFNIDIKNSDLLTEVLVPGLTKLRPGEIKGVFTSRTNNLDVIIDIPEVAYNNISVLDFAFELNSNKSRMNYAVNIGSITQDSTLVKNILLNGGIADNKISTALRISDDEKKEKFVIGGLLQSVEKAFRFRFNQVVLDYEKWSVNEDNYLQFGDDKFFANNIKLQNQNQVLGLNTINRSEKVPDFEVLFDNFNLDFISSIAAEKKQLAVGGILDGKVILEKFPGGGSFTSDLKIANFSFKQDTLGNITLLASNATKNQYDVKLTVTGEGNDLRVGGYYLADPKSSSLNFDVNIVNLNLSTIENYTAGQATKMSGALTGSLSVMGNTASPKVNGAVKFKEAGFNVTYLKSYFLLDNESINFDPRGVHFNSFEIKDEKNNVASIDGSILSSDFKTFALQLDLTTKNFRVMNTGADDNEMFYGTVLVDSKIKIRGTTSNPKIEAAIWLKDATNFTFVIPPDDPSKATGEGVYEFIDFSNKLNPIFKQPTKEDTLNADIKGVNLTVAINIDKNAQFNIVIDKERGDILNLKGRADEMVFGMDESGKTTLSGRYVVNEGNYKLSFYGVVNKDFALKKGSTLVWAGEPLDAKVDISAIHTVKTSSINLMAGGDTDPKLKQKLPYQVYLNMKGELMHPEISFDIKLPERYAVRNEAIKNKLAFINENEAEKNQQVFALIILGGFIANNSLSTGNGEGLEASARGSVSELLSQQLDKLSDKYVKGVDINVGLESSKNYDNNAAGENSTALNVGVSKQLFNDRVEVQVGSSIDLEGESSQNATSSSSQNIVGDMSVLYKLTDDGRYKLKAFRENEYDQTAQGDVIKTGVSLQFTREYNRLKELLRKSKEEEELKVIDEED